MTLPHIAFAVALSAIGFIIGLWIFILRLTASIDRIHERLDDVESVASRAEARTRRLADRIQPLEHPRMRGGAG